MSYPALPGLDPQGSTPALPAASTPSPWDQATAAPLDAGAPAAAAPSPAPVTAAAEASPWASPFERSPWANEFGDSPEAPPPLVLPSETPLARRARRPSPAARLWKASRGIIETMVMAVIMFLLVSQVIQPVRVEGISMQPTLKADEYMVVLKPFYTPAHGDIVVLQLPTATVPYIKRVIGLPGDVITLQGGKLYINGTPLAEPYVNNGLEGQDGQWGPIPAGAYFVMGDNRDNSSDSRVFGAVPRNEITGRVFLEVTPNIRMVP